MAIFNANVGEKILRAQSLIVAFFATARSSWGWKHRFLFGWYYNPMTRLLSFHVGGFVLQFDLWHTAWLHSQ